MELEDIVTSPHVRVRGSSIVREPSERRVEERRRFASVLVWHGFEVTVEVLDDLVEILRDHTPEKWHGLGRVQRQKLFIQEKGICFVCGLRCTASDFTVEHKINRADGGADEWENFSISHQKCNQKRESEDRIAREGSSVPLEGRG